MPRAAQHPRPGPSYGRNLAAEATTPRTAGSARSTIPTSAIPWCSSSCASSMKEFVEVVKLSKHYPSLDPTKDLDTLSDHAVVMRGDVVEIPLIAACQGVGPFHPAPCSPPGSYRNLPFTFTCIVQTCRCYHLIEGCCLTGTVCYRQEGSDRIQVLCPQTHAFRMAWGSSWKSKAALMATLVNLMHPRA